jgi:uncharacterized membrane protein
MAEPGDPRTPADHPDDHDDLIGFANPASLHGRPRAIAPTPEPVAPPEPRPEPAPTLAFEPEPVRMAAPVEPDPDLFDPPVAEPALPEPAPIRPEIAPAQARSIFEPSPEFAARGQRRRTEVQDEPGGMGLYAVYALILFAVPTLGVSAAVGLLAVTGREGPEGALARSHFVYQQRTLWAAAVAAVAGVILLAAPFALGVPVLFLLALWTVIRGASGVWKLKSGRPIGDARSWWI